MIFVYKVDQCIQNMTDTTKMLRLLGFTIHAEKSNHIPKTKLGILGFTIDWVKMEVLITQLNKKRFNYKLIRN